MTRVQESGQTVSNCDPGHSSLGGCMRRRNRRLLGLVGAGVLAGIPLAGGMGSGGAAPGKGDVPTLPRPPRGAVEPRAFPTAPALPPLVPVVGSLLLDP